MKRKRASGGRDTPASLAEFVAGQIAEKLKITAPKLPFTDYVPEMPRDITKLGDEALSKLYGEFCAYANHVAWHTVHFEVDHLEVENDVRETETLERLALAEEDGPASQKKDLAFMTERAKRSRRLKLEKKAKYKILGSRLTGLERSISTLSREQTRREKDHERRQRLTT